MGDCWSRGPLSRAARTGTTQWPHTGGDHASMGTGMLLGNRSHSQLPSGQGMAHTRPSLVIQLQPLDSKQTQDDSHI